MFLSCPQCNEDTLEQCNCPIDGPDEGAHCLKCGWTHLDPPLMPDFQKFPEIPRFNRDIIITEKIDGTNAQIYITEAGTAHAGSRNRWLTVEHDNYGFAAWVGEHQEELLELGPGRHFGEWWGQGVNRGYGLDHRRFSLFNVSRWQSVYDENFYRAKFEKGKEVEIKRTIPPACCSVVPILGTYPRLDSFFVKGIAYLLEKLGSRAAPGFMDPEGIVIFHTPQGNLFKITFENDDKPKGKTNGQLTQCYNTNPSWGR